MAEEMSFEEMDKEFLSRAAHIEQLHQEQESLLSEMNDVDAEMAELNDKLKALKARKTEAEGKRWDNHKELKAENERIEALKRRMAMEAEARRVAELAAMRGKSIDEATKGEAWRDRVLPHQWDGALYLSASQRAILADDMGLGKTLTSMAVARILKVMGDSKGRVLGIMPGGIIENFTKELDDWFEGTNYIMLGGLQSGSLGTKNILESIEMMRSFGDDYYAFINYEILARSSDVVDALTAEGFDTVFLDEAHKIKEISKPTYKAVEKIVLGHNVCSVCGEIGSPITVGRWDDRKNFCPKHGENDGKSSVANVIPMTGTPILNRPDEIFSMLHLIDPVAFDTVTNFQQDFCERDYKGKWGWGYAGKSKLVKKIRGSYIGRSRGDAGVVLPKQAVNYIDIEIDAVSYPKQYKIMKMLAAEARIELENGKAASIFSALPLITRQRQAAVWPGGIWMNVEERDSNGVIVETRKHVGAMYLESAKLDRCAEMIKDFVDQKQRVVVFSKFLEPLKEMMRRDVARGCLYAGETDAYMKSRIKKNFDRAYAEEPEWDVVYCQYDVAGLGLNLNAATQAIVLDQEWNEGMSDQAWKRIDRMGQTEETAVHILSIVNKQGGGIDKWMTSLIKDKAYMVAGLKNELQFAELADVFNSNEF